MRKFVMVMVAIILAGSFINAFCLYPALAQGVVKPASKPQLAGEGLIGTYHYVGGKIAGYELNDYLKNTGSTGSVTIKATLKFAGTASVSKTKTFNAKAGKKYHISIDAGLVAGGKSRESSVVVLSSADMASADEFKIEKTMLASIGEIRIEEVKSNADLADLKVYAGRQPLIFDYDGAGSAHVDKNVAAVTVFATADDVDALVRINGQVVKSGAPKAVSLKTGDNEIKIAVTSPDKTVTKTKVLRIVRSSSTVSNKWEKSYSYVSALKAVGSEVYAIVGDSGNSFLSISPDGKVKKLFTTPEKTRALVMGKDGTIYTISDTKLYALKADGKIKWTFDQKDIMNICVGGDNTVYILGFAATGYKVTALNPSGKKLWEMGTNAAGSTLFSAGPDNTLLCNVIERNGREETCKLCSFRSDNIKVWEVPFKGSMYDLTVGSDGMIYLAAYEKLIIIDPKNGSVLSEIPLDVNPQKIGVGQDGTIYFAADGYGKKTPTTEGGKPAYIMEDPYGAFCAYTKDGAKKWEYKAKESFYGFAFTPAGEPVVGSGGHMLIKMDTAGTKKQEYITSCIPYESPVISADGSIYYRDENKIISFGK